MAKRTKKTKTPKAPTSPAYVPAMGARLDVEGVACEIKVVNAGRGWLFPIVSDPEDSAVMTHVAYGKVDETGKVTRV